MISSVGGAVASGADSGVGGAGVGSWGVVLLQPTKRMSERRESNFFMVMILKCEYFRVIDLHGKYFAF